MSTIHFQLVTPEKTVLTEELESLSCPTTMGQITILPGHVPLVATLVPGELVARSIKGEEGHFFHVSGGFVQVKEGTVVTVLADAAEHFHEIDISRAEEAKNRAEKLMKESTLSDEEYASVRASLERNLSRINIARKHSHRRTSPITSQGVMEE
jgi:F-type H+-transporting ATPase subunit epsilon